MNLTASPEPVEAPNIARMSETLQDKAGLVPSTGITLGHRTDEPAELGKPPLLKHVSTPAYGSPLRHHRRHPSTPHKVKESLNARSEYITSQDDGAAEHRINQYIIKQEIGRGSFGAVHMAIDQYGQEFAVKEFSKSRLRKRAQSHILRQPLGQRRRGSLQGFNSPLHRRAGETNEIPGNSLDLIREEIAIMKKLNHPNLVTLIEVLDDPSEDSLYMVMEMCKKGVVMKVGLDQIADPYPDDTCRCWFRDLLLGIEYLHAQGVVHRDIKPDNCLITDDDVLKIVDFGVSEMFEKDSEMYTAKSAGSPAFLPPELCIAKHGDVSGKAADIWSMGVTLYCLKFGTIPFHKHQIFDMYDAIKADTPDISKEKNQDFRDLMLRILEKDPSKRIKMHELREHPWVTKGGTDPLLTEKENTADMIDPPTEAEVDAAITGNMRGLMTVVKAVKKFKDLTTSTRPPVMASILGDSAENRFSEPPSQYLTNSRSSPRIDRRSHSWNIDNRTPLESALVAEGVHRDLGHKEDLSSGASRAETAFKQNELHVTDQLYGQLTGSDDESDEFPHSELPTPSGSHRLPPFRSSVVHSHTIDDIGRRGHAHDPLEDQLYLRIGPSTFAGHSSTNDDSSSFTGDEDDDNVYIVSESPGAADMDIYETAYRDEIERILARAKAEDKEPQVYLTRRVDEKLIQLSGLAGKLMAHGEEAKSQFKDYTQFSARKARATEVSRALREAAKAEYEKRRQERRALLEAAKAERIKTQSESPADGRVESRPSPWTRPSGSEMPRSDEIWQSSRNVWKSKAVDRGKSAKTSVKGFVDLVKKSRGRSRDDPV